MSVKGTPEDRSWADYREEVFGTPYMVWHDGPYFGDIARDYAEDPDYVLAMVRKDILENDDVAAQVPREVEATDEQKATLVALLEEVMPETYGGRGGALSRCGSTSTPRPSRRWAWSGSWRSSTVVPATCATRPRTCSPGRRPGCPTRIGCTRSC